MTEIAIDFADVVTIPNGTAFDVQVPLHSCVAIVGGEKSGIDELCAVALGLAPALGGIATVRGQDVGALPRSEALAFRRKLGYLPRGDGLMQNLSLRDNVALPLKFGSDHTRKAIEGRVNVILAALRISEVAKLRPAATRDEHRRRAAFARALAFDPEILLLEAPFDGMTDSASIELLEIARGGEHSEGSRRTVLLTAQHLSVAIRTRVDRVIRATRGRLTVERSQI